MQLIKSRVMRWVGHVACIGGRGEERVLLGRLEAWRGG